MTDLIQLFINNGGGDFTIKKSDRVSWLTYSKMTRDDFRQLEELGFVFHKRVKKTKIGEEVTGKVVPFLYFFKKLVDKKIIPVYKEEDEIIMKARPKKPTLGVL